MIKPQRKRHPVMAIATAAVCALTLYYGHGKSFISVTKDPHEVSCLPEMHLALLVHFKPHTVSHGDYLFWKPTELSALAYVKEDFVLKKVAGVPGDHLSITDGSVRINGVVVASGFGDAAMYGKSPTDFEKKEEIIPADAYFMIGTHPLSNDSRYWGYLFRSQVTGEAYRIY